MYNVQRKYCIFADLNLNYTINRMKQFRLVDNIIMGWISFS